LKTEYQTLKTDADKLTADLIAAQAKILEQQKQLTVANGFVWGFGTFSVIEAVYIILHILKILP
jgi:hypothetical protein